MLTFIAIVFRGSNASVCNLLVMPPTFIVFMAAAYSPLIVATACSTLLFLSAFLMGRGLRWQPTPTPQSPPPAPPGDTVPPPQPQAPLDDGGTAPPPPRPPAPQPKYRPRPRVGHPQQLYWVSTHQGKVFHSRRDCGGATIGLGRTPSTMRPPLPLRPCLNCWATDQHQVD